MIAAGSKAAGGALAGDVRPAPFSEEPNLAPQC
jgi:hypothetical protein